MYALASRHRQPAAGTWSDAGSKPGNVRRPSLHTGPLAATLPWGHAAAAAAAGVVLLHCSAAAAARVEPCRPRTPCVSTASFLSPSQYLPPLSFAPDTRATAARALLRALEDAHAADVRSEEGPDTTVVTGTIPYQGGRDNDAVVFVLRDDGVALFSAASAAARPDPPFCLKPGCISGPAERGRMAALRDALGWTALEGDGGEDSKWVQILLH